MEVDKAKIASLAGLMALNLSDAEQEELSQKLTQRFASWKTVTQVDTVGIEPQVNVVERSQFLREDEVSETNRRDELQQLAPAVEDGLYLVPKVIE